MSAAQKVDFGRLRFSTVDASADSDVAGGRATIELERIPKFLLGSPRIDPVKKKKQILTTPCTELP